MSRTILSSTLLAASAFILPATGTWAQESTNNPNHAGGVEGSRIATPQPGPNEGFNPALTTGKLPKSQEAGVPPDKNPNVGGATGNTVVPGNKSTVSENREKTTATKTGK